MVYNEAAGMDLVKSQIGLDMPANKEGWHTLDHYYIVGLLHGAVGRGYDPHAILAKAAISAERYDDSQATINGAEVQRLVRAIRDELSDKYLGFLDQPAKLSMDAEVGKVALQHDTLGAAIKGMSDFVEAVRNDQERFLNIDDSTGEYTYGMRCELSSGHEESSYYLYYYSMVWTYRFLCWLMGKRIKLTRVCFMASRPGTSADHDEAFGCPVEFGSTWNSMHFHKHYLKEPIIRTITEFNHADFTDNYPDWFDSPGRNDSKSNAVERVLLETHRQETFLPSIERVAEILDVSPRTLRRHLAFENDSYQKIKDKVRRERAEELLASTNLAIHIISSSLGFSEPGVFTRAFRAWTLTTPSDYRKTHGIYS
jgi:AraC-like DNA-binding protein